MIPLSSRHFRSCGRELRRPLPDMVCRCEYIEKAVPNGDNIWSSILLIWWKANKSSPRKLTLLRNVTQGLTLNSSPDINEMIKSRGMRWAQLVGAIREMRDAYKISVTKTWRKKPLGNIKSDITEIGWKVWTVLIWPRTRNGGDLLWYENETPDPIKRWKFHLKKESAPSMGWSVT
jgi:hypothetical protein